MLRAPIDHQHASGEFADAGERVLVDPPDEADAIAVGEQRDRAAIARAVRIGPAGAIDAAERCSLCGSRVCTG